MKRTPSEEIRETIRRVLQDWEIGARQLEARIGLKKWSLRGILDPTRPGAPSVDRAAEICAALVLEFRVGSAVNASSWPELSRRLQEAAAIAESLELRGHLLSADLSEHDAQLYQDIAHHMMRLTYVLAKLKPPPGADG